MNEYRGEHIINIDGKEMILKYNMNKLVRIKNALGVSGLKNIMGALKDADPETIILFVSEGVSTKEKIYTAEEIGEMDFSVLEATEQMSKALSKALGIKEEDLEKAQKEQLNNNKNYNNKKKYYNNKKTK